MSPATETPLKIAIATNDMEHLNAHFGSARKFAVYEVTRSDWRFVEAIGFDSFTEQSGRHAEGDDKIGPKVEALAGVALLFVLAIGGPAAAKVVRCGIHPVKLKDPEPISADAAFSLCLSPSCDDCPERAECFAVDAGVIERAIRVDKLTDLDSVTSHAKAGGGCSSCREPLEELLASVNAAMVAEGVIAAEAAYVFGSAAPRPKAKKQAGFVPPDAPPTPSPVQAAPVAMAPIAIAPLAAPAPAPAAIAIAPLPAATLAGRTPMQEAILVARTVEGMRATFQADCGDVELVDLEGSLEPSHVLRAMDSPFTAAHGAIRFSLSRETTDAEADRVLEAMPAIIARLRTMSPFWAAEGPAPAAFTPAYA